MKQTTSFFDSTKEILSSENSDVQLQYDLSISVAKILINRPAQLNALNKSVINGLNMFLELVRSKHNIRSVIITGSGTKAFVAGADIKEFKDYSFKEAKVLSSLGKEQLFDKIINFPKPVVAMINGYALGGGLELALACHIRTINTGAKLALPECSLGLIPGYGGTQRLPQIIGKNLAMEMILTGKMITADEAYRIGLVNLVTSEKKLFDATISFTKTFHISSPQAMTAAIKSINSCYLKDGDICETKEFAKLFETANFKEGVSAFLEKRRANFR